MEPKDFPLQPLGEQELRLVSMADTQRERAREATRSNVDGAEGLYESALAFFEAARQTGQTRDYMIAQLDRIAAKEAAQVSNPHRWPIPHLLNLSQIQRDIAISQDNAQTFPQWGVEGYTGTSDTDAHVRISRSAHGNDELILTFTEGPNADKPPTKRHSVNLQAAQWEALMALGRRVLAGEPIPYDQAGNYRAVVTDE
jgi:hypothetical protein